ncbi:hypothetical protein C8J57DRAFT_1722804 [Mycena rebaudengoi]|nr:hypothetical protein C8J57DRAFT_1722804 [Mycena rebaudengoi]
MPNNIGETSLEFASLTDSFLSNGRAAASVGTASILVLAIACIVHHIWPMRLTHVLVAFMQETEKLYYGAVEAGELPGDVDTEEKLLSLQTKVSEVREESLRNSLSTWTALGDFFRGRSIMPLQSTNEIQSFKTHIEILKEAHLRRNLSSINRGTAALAMSLKRRQNRSVAA